jgi:hypothetical protein
MITPPSTGRSASAAAYRLKKGSALPYRDNTRPVIAMINPPAHIALLVVPVSVHFEGWSPWSSWSV